VLSWGLEKIEENREVGWLICQSQVSIESGLSKTTRNTMKHTETENRWNSLAGQAQLKHFRGLNVLAIAALLPVLGLQSFAEKLQIERKAKNVVVILADDHALGVSGYAGNKQIRTPNIDRMASGGFVFQQAYCSSPICSASRQSLLTGKYPPATGVNLLFTPFPDEGNTTIAEYLKNFGYCSALIGKTHWNNWIWGSLYQDGLPQHGFDEVIETEDYAKYLKAANPEPVAKDEDYWIPGKISQEDVAGWMNCRALPHPVRDENSMGTYFARRAIEFMGQEHDGPFLLWLAFKEPHHPYYFPVEYRGRYRPQDMVLPEGSPEDDRWIPQKFRELNDAQKRGIIAAYYTSTEYLDKNIGLVLDGIKELGLEDDTVVLYLSDNGYLLNDHKRFEKHCFWQQAVHQPMIWCIPGLESDAGKQSNALVSYVDVVPTLLDVLKLPPLREVQGESFLPVLNGSSVTHRDAVFATYLQDNMAMVCEKQWKYVFHTGSRDLSIGYATGYGPSGIFHRLYDLENDPMEMHNVAAAPENFEILSSLQSRLLEFFEQTHPDAGRCPDGLNLIGKLVWFCEPRDIGEDQELDESPKRVFDSEL